jgi:hypothetical protein
MARTPTSLGRGSSVSKAGVAIGIVMVEAQETGKKKVGGGESVVGSLH